MKALLEALQPGEKDWVLAQTIDPARMPRISPSLWTAMGAGRHRSAMPRIAGHKAGITPVRTTVETCARLGVKVLTLYAFSVETGSVRGMKWRRCGGCCAST